MKTNTNSLKKILGIETAPPLHWVGDGFPVRSMFSYDRLGESLSPFLLLDYAAPAEFSPTDEPRGVGAHPHRGFETVTVVYHGEVEHRDSAGNRGKIGPGDVQWMTAGRGVLHEEFHGREFTRRGGTLEMVQLWVNLPAKAKMSPPAYQDILDRRIPNVPLPNGAGTLRVIAGTFGNTKGPARTFTPVNLWDLRVRAGARATLRIPEGHTTALLVLHGAVDINGSSTVRESELVVLDPRGDTVEVEVRKDATILVMGGEPIDEPIVGYGPFVMNTQEEIEQAISDYENGRLGVIAR